MRFGFQNEGDEVKFKTEGQVLPERRFCAIKTISLVDYEVQCLVCGQMKVDSNTNFLLVTAELHTQAGSNSVHSKLQAMLSPYTPTLVLMVTTYIPPPLLYLTSLSLL